MLRTALWAVAVQLVLVNLSAALYAWKFIHLGEGTVVPRESNVLTKTWRLFSGPRIQRMPEEIRPAFSYDSFQLQLSDQTSVAGWYSGNSNSQACVILLHGYTANRSYLLHEAAYFRSRGLNVLLPAFRSHGASNGSTNTLGHDESEEVEKAFAYAQSKGNSRIILYGVSMGAVAAMKSVAEGRIRPAALIADMPFASLHDHLKARARLVGFPSQPFAFLVTAWIGAESGFNGFTHDTRDYAKDLDCPVLLQWGDTDEYVTEKETREIFSHLKTPQKKLAIYNGVGHHSFLHADPLKWERAVGGFLAPIVRRET